MVDSNPTSDSGTVELAGSEGTQDVSPTSTEVTPPEGAVSLEQLNALAGRVGDNAFKSVEDFEKHYGNLKSFVGKKTEAPVPVPVTPDPAPAPQEVSSEDAPVTRAELDLRDFKAAHPEAAERADIIQTIAKQTGVDLETAFKDSGIKAGIEAEQAREESKSSEEAVGVTGANRVASIDTDNDQLEEQYKTNPTREVEEALVRSVLGADNDAIRTKLSR